MLYKLTDQDNKTRVGKENETLWGKLVKHKATGDGTNLCSDGFIHAYEHPLVAVFMNPAHANISQFKMWEAEGEVVIREGQLKCGCKELTTIREIPVPELTLEQRVEIGIRCAMTVYKDDEWDSAWLKWANSWLDGSDRSYASAFYASAANAARYTSANYYAASAANAARYTSANYYAASAANAANAANTKSATVFPNLFSNYDATTTVKELDLVSIIEMVVNKGK